MYKTPLNFVCIAVVIGFTALALQIPARAGAIDEDSCLKDFAISAPTVDDAGGVNRTDYVVGPEQMGKNLKRLSRKTDKSSGNQPTPVVQQ